jgi:uncharacterized protein (DUF779 family)
LPRGDLAVSARGQDPPPDVEQRALVATDAAIAEIRRLKAERGPLEFFQSGGCCDGSSPMCFPAGEFRVGSHDVLIGEVEGCPFYVEEEQYERWGKPSFVLDVGPGAGSGLSLEGLHDVHFRLAATDDGAICAAPRR